MARQTSIAFALLLAALSAAAQGVWLDVPYIHQQRDGCGSASLAMVMQYWELKQGREASPVSDEVAIQRALFSPKAHGIYASAMTKYLEANGYRAFAIAGDFALLQQHLEKGRPLIVALNPGAGLPLHYVVVVGLDSEQKVVLVNDPEVRKLLKLDQEEFEKQWKAAGHWTLLAVPAG
jgi:ABC-type bacteriocin/lantibiotic exporter with double-glycine peptidase domain